jgi:SAM-dependent methyltransferase
MPAEPTSTLYDAVPYPGMFHAETHPARIYTVAAVLDLEPARPERCRVLEVGAGDGTNLIAMAEALPESQFLGIDYAASHIATGQAAISALGVTNIRLKHRNLLDFGAEEGEFDYILAHGLLSWVPSVVQDALFAICAANLTPNGVAYISYATYPGSHSTQLMRVPLLAATRAAASPIAGEAAARELAAFLAENVLPADDGYADAVRDYARRLERRETQTVVHDELGDHYTPFYFKDFVAMAEAHGLAYLHDARFSSLSGLKPELTAAVAERAADATEAEQLVDLLTNRSFRRSLLCRADRIVNRTLDFDAATLRNYFVQADFRPTPAATGTADAETRYRSSSGVVLAPRQPVGAAALAVLGEAFPAFVSFEDLVAAAALRAGSDDPAGDATAVATTLILIASMDDTLVTLWPYEPGCTAEPGNCPTLSAFSRYRVARGAKTIASHLHRAVAIDPLAAAIVPAMDGLHTRADLLALLRAAYPATPTADLEAELAATLELFAQTCALTRA